MKIYLTLLVISFSKILFSQTDYTITYSEKIFWEISDSLNYSSDFKKSLTNQMNKKHYYELNIKGNESLYKPIHTINNSIKNGGVSVSFSESENWIYTNLKDSIFITEETYPKTFHVKGKLRVLNWELLNENITHLSYNVKKAKFSNSRFDITAYYTEELPLSYGPKKYNMLPGVILILEIVDKRSKEKTQIIAEKIEKNIEMEESLRPPHKKLISEEEYEKIFLDFIEKEKEMYSNGVDVN